MTVSGSNLMRKFVIAALTVVFVAACAPLTETVKLYEDPSGVDTQFTKLLIIDVSSDNTVQRNFENKIVARLGEEGVDAVPSHARLDSSEGLVQDDIDEMASDVGADGILITHIASVDTSAELKKGREDLVSTCRKGDPTDYFLYDRKVLVEPNSVKIAHTVVVITNLYDVASGKRIWTVQSTCFRKESMEAALLDEANAIVGQLRSDELIQGT